MKLKKKAKRLIIIILLIIVLVIGIIIVPKLIPKKTTKPEIRVINKIEAYGYELRDNKSKKYQAEFKELSKILAEKEVDEELYAKKLSEMFITDFYSLSDKTSKTDVGGVDIVHPDTLANFLENAENTFYKYVESNVYNNRNQKLPEVDNITVDSLEAISYSYKDTTDEKAYSVKVSWDYTSDEFSDYQSSATLIFVHQDKKLYLVELK